MEAAEFVQRFTTGGELPLITSCCPSWVDYMEKRFSDFVPNFSTAKSPQQMLGVLAGVMVGITPGPIPALRREAVFAGCLLATAAALFQFVSFNLSRHAFKPLKHSGETLQPLGAAYLHLLGGCLVAVELYAISWVMQRQSREPLQPHAQPAPFPKSPLLAPVWVALNALFGPVLGVTCMLWAISLVANPGMVQTVSASSTLLTVPFARRLEAARPQTLYLPGCLLARGGIAGLLLC